MQFLIGYLPIRDGQDIRVVWSASLFLSEAFFAYVNFATSTITRFCPASGKRPRSTKPEKSTRTCGKRCRRERTSAAG